MIWTLYIKSYTSIVQVLPPPVCPYAKTVPLNPEITAILVKFIHFIIGVATSL